MQLQLRETGDPFTRALRRLAKESDNRQLLREQIRKEMIPLVTQVAIKIGGIDTEASIRDRAIPVFTGTISLHLVHQTNGLEGDPMERWVKEITPEALKEQFRNGFSLVHQLVHLPHEMTTLVEWVNTQKKKVRIKGAGNPIEYLEEYAPKVEKGIWSGYGALQEHFHHRLHLKGVFNLAFWLAQETGSAQDVIVGSDLDANTLVCRVMLNVMHSGRTIISMDYRKIESIAKARTAGKAWVKEAEERYKKFLSSIPSQIQKDLVLNGEFEKHFRYFLNAIFKLKSHMNKRLSPKGLAAELCGHVGIMPPDMREEIKHEEKELKRIEDEEK